MCYNHFYFRGFFARKMLLLVALLALHLIPRTLLFTDMPFIKILLTTNDGLRTASFPRISFLAHNAASTIIKNFLHFSVKTPDH